MPWRSVIDATTRDSADEGGVHREAQRYGAQGHYPPRQSQGARAVTDLAELNALMRRYGRGENSAFEELYKLLAPRLYRFCTRLAVRRAEVEDLFQETFLKLHRARATYLAGANALLWVFAIARSVSLDRLRYLRRRPEDLGVENDATVVHELVAHEGHRPEFELFAQDLHQIVSVELQRMSEKNRAAYILIREEELSVKEAALVLGTTTHVVKQRAHRAYEQLRCAINAAEGVHPCEAR
jgi:RNA polymerase sigma-70 factor, ECF subfamily